METTLTIGSVAAWLGVAFGRAVAAKFCDRQNGGRANDLLNVAAVQAGELDGLCGVYAAINAVRLILGPGDRRLSNDDWLAMFAEIFGCADASVGAATPAINGIETRYFRKLLKAVSRHLRHVHNIDVASRLLIPRQSRPSFPMLLKEFRQITDQPNQAVVFTVEGFISHWTVLRRVGDRHLVLFDSSGYHRLTLANCRMPYEAPRKSREHSSHPTRRLSSSCATTVETIESGRSSTGR